MKKQQLPEIREYMDRARRSGMTLRDIATRSGLPISTVHSIAQGRISNPTLDTVQRLAKGIGVRPVEVLAPFGISIGVTENPPCSESERRLVECEVAYHLLLEKYMGHPDAPIAEIDRAGAELHEAVLAVIQERGIELPMPSAETKKEPNDVLDSEFIDDTDF